MQPQHHACGGQHHWRLPEGDTACMCMRMRRCCCGRASRASAPAAAASRSRRSARAAAAQAGGATAWRLSSTRRARWPASCMGPPPVLLLLRSSLPSCQAPVQSGLFLHAGAHAQNAERPSCSPTSCSSCHVRRARGGGCRAQDAASALLGAQVGADMLLLLTDAPAVYDPARWPAERAPVRSPIQARALLASGDFARGSMAPKVRFCLQFMRRLCMHDAGRCEGLQVGELQERVVWNMMWHADVLLCGGCGRRWHRRVMRHAAAGAVGVQVCTGDRQAGRHRSPGRRAGHRQGREGDAHCAMSAAGRACPLGARAAAPAVQPVRQQSLGLQ